jgi:hypothetical protein
MGLERQGWRRSFSFSGIFLLRGQTAFLRGVLRKCVFLTWFFDGEVVVDCW